LFTPFITNGREHSCCCRSLFGMENPMQECPNRLFEPRTLEIQCSLVTKAQRYHDSVVWYRRDLVNIVDILPSSPDEGIAIKNKLKEWDKLAGRISEIKANKDAWEKYNHSCAEYDRLQVSLPRLQGEADAALQEKRRKHAKLQRLKRRKHELERTIDQGQNKLRTSSSRPASCGCNHDSADDTATTMQERLLAQDERGLESLQEDIIENLRTLNLLLLCMKRPRIV